MMGIFGKLFGDYSSREVKKIQHYVDDINKLEPEMEALSDTELKGKTDEFKSRLANGETLDDLLVEAFAVVREASKRVFGKRPFDVQLIGGIILHQGRIAEMKTGEGKTLTATLPVYLNALTGHGVHLVTVNDFLAKTQGEEMGKLYNFLGLSIGVIVHDLTPMQRKEAYAADITYGTNNEFGFDYLRDNMAVEKSQIVQRELNYAIVDEIDSILIDEARTPLIISGQADKANDLYKKADSFVKSLRAKVIAKTDSKEEETEDDNQYDYIVDEKARTATLTQKGVKKAEQEFHVDNLSDIENTTLYHHINAALKANGTMHEGIDYIVEDGQVLIVDEHTGRIMYGRRYNEGLHQAIEAKEGVKIANESKTLATITFQNYFRMFKKLCGMTGTAMTEEQEFREIYKLDVVAIPTNKPMIRIDHNDVVYLTERAKLRAIIDDIKESYDKGQPVLVGTVSVEKSEMLSALLNKEGIPHTVLNAKYHAKEADIVAQAGQFKAITVSTNMAGRGTDIMLGGNTEALAKRELRKQGYDEDTILNAVSLNETDDPEVLEVRKLYHQIYDELDKEVQADREKVIAAGGLKIIGTERHSARRIDNQLRGRSGRQGDIGESRFYISLDDDLMRLFGSDRMKMMVGSLNVPEDQPLTVNFLTKAIERAQKNIESMHYSARKHVLQFDDVMNKQRENIYSQRLRVLEGEDMHETVEKMIKETVESAVYSYLHADSSDDAKEALENYIYQTFDIEYKVEDKDANLVNDEVSALALDKLALKEKEFGEEQFRKFERYVILRTVDDKWMDHLETMEQLKDSANLQAYGQKDPILQYRNESYGIFNDMTDSIKENVARVCLHQSKVSEEQTNTANLAKATDLIKKIIAQRQAEAQSNGSSDTKKQPVRVDKSQKVGRNDPCPCGSGKKYKNCCGKNA
ncbi:MAG: preprotein translocase subunit SecA [Clostridia bacterium]|nr:preprotein translocase subunit SecA [Clostridia bacterium]